tara:strand:+ start:106 stop:372 length:267 start_codon:yes stop_codon:yes gene_type:complete
MSRISEMTSREKGWMDRLASSDLASGDFTAAEAVITLRNIPIKCGKLPRDVPNKFKLQYVMRKSEQFELIETRGLTDKKLNLWRVKNA